MLLNPFFFFAPPFVSHGKAGTEQGGQWAAPQLDRRTHGHRSHARFAMENRELSWTRRAFPALGATQDLPRAPNPALHTLTPPAAPGNSITHLPEGIKKLPREPSGAAGGGEGVARAAQC